MLLRIFMMSMVLLMYQNLGAMGGGSGTTAPKKYTVALATADDLGQIIALAGSRGEETKKAGKASSDDDDTIPDDESTEGLSNFFNPAIDILKPGVIPACVVVVARDEKEIVGYVVSVSKANSVKLGLEPVSTKRKKVEYCTVAEIFIASAHASDKLYEQLIEEFVKQQMRDVKPQPTEVFFAIPESSSVSRTGNRNWDSYAQRLQHGELFAPRVGAYIASHGGGGGGGRSSCWCKC